LGNSFKNVALARSLLRETVGGPDIMLEKDCWGLRNFNQMNQDCLISN